MDSDTRSGHDIKISSGKRRKVSYSEVEQKRCRTEQGELGECVVYLKPGAEGTIKADVRWHGGIYLGMRLRTEEHLIGTDHGVIKVRSIRRRGMTDLQWDNT